MKLFPLVLMLASLACSSPKPFFSQSTLFEAGQDGYPSYRIPSAILTPRGSVLVFCEGRLKPSDSGEIHLLMRRSTDAGVNFSSQRVIVSDPPNTFGNPCPVVDSAAGTIHLLLTHNLGQDSEKQITAGTSRGTRTVWLTSSSDDGLTWSPPR